jgi:glycogen debranching enzyme
MGLRSLSPHDPQYRGRYEGDPWHRDGAYHQGTVWQWLIGPYVEAALRVRGDSPAAKAAIRARLEPLAEHLCQAGLGTISEIADGDPPHRPDGCPAQAWSVAELLRAWLATA